MADTPLRAMRRRYAALLDPALCLLDRGFRPPLDLSAADPIIVLGNQKTGSTAIATLLARLGSLSFTPDVRPAWELEPELVSGELSLGRFIQENRYYFRKDLVKENALTLCLDRVRRVLPRARFAFTVREPVQNIRSILDRLDLPGELRRLDRIDLPPGTFRHLADTRCLGQEVDELISSLATRWVLTARQYLGSRDQVHLLKYETFCSDKTRTIRSLAHELGVEPKQEIAEIVDHQFQTLGEHRGVEPDRFFARDALSRIRDICGPTAQALDYA